MVEFRRLGQSTLRSKSPLLLPFLIPTIPPPWLYDRTTPRTKQVHKKRRLSQVSHFTTTACKCADPPQSSAADFERFFKEQPQKSKGSDRTAHERTDTTDYQANIDKLFDRLIPKPKENSYTEARKAYQAQAKQDGQIASMMSFPGTAGSPLHASTTEHAREVLRAAIDTLPVNPLTKRTVRSRPTVGRTIELDPSRGIDLARSYRMLNGLCAQNKIRSHLMNQRFHERPGIKRKRLKQERWRRFFKSGFVATVERVKEMRRKGW